MIVERIHDEPPVVTPPVWGAINYWRLAMAVALGRAVRRRGPVALVRVDPVYAAAQEQMLETIRVLPKPTTDESGSSWARRVGLPHGGLTIWIYLNRRRLPEIH